VKNVGEIINVTVSSSIDNFTLRLQNNDASFSEFPGLSLPSETDGIFFQYTDESGWELISS